MNPIKFNGVNATYAENQPEYLPLPVKKFYGPEGAVLSCWSLSLREKIRVFLSGRIYLVAMTFGEPLQPILLSTNRGDIETEE